MVSDSCFSFFKFSVGFGTTIGGLWDICGLSVAFVYIIFTLKNQCDSSKRIFSPVGHCPSMMTKLGDKVAIASRNTIGARLKLTGKHTFSIAQSAMELGNRERTD